VKRASVVHDSYLELNALGPDLKRTVQARAACAQRPACARTAYLSAHKDQGSGVRGWKV